MSYSNEQIYHNCKVLSPEGIEMFRCHRKKFDWYIKKGLATVEPNSTDTIRLKFRPNGLGWAGDHYYLQDRENKCCCCGSEKKLTKHHVVPYCYRKEFPDRIKDSNYYDVLPLCVECHTVYEKHATKKKKIISEKYNAPLQGISNTNKQSAKLAKTLVQYGHVIPEDRKQAIIERIKQETKNQSLKNEDLEKLAKKGTLKQPEDYISHAQIVVSKIEDFQLFVEEWREHFVQTMNPKYLPKHWDVKRDLHGQKEEKLLKNRHTNVEQQSRIEAFFPKLFCVFTSFIGCLVLFVAPFYVPLVNLLGAIATSIGSAILSGFMLFVAMSGFNYAAKLSKNVNYPVGYLIMIYMVSMFSILLSLRTFCRLIVWIFYYFFDMKIEWNFIPE